jgi:hypothetical protein
MKTLVYLLLVVIVVIIGCDKDDSGTVIQSQVFEVKATGSTTWKYFSFAENDTITVDDPLTSTAWDLAFQRYRIKTNGGKSGNGQGSAANSYAKGQTGFDALNIVPDTATFSLDDEVEIAVQQGYATYIINPEIYSWFTMEMATQGTQIVPSDYIYFIKTGDGKYAKIWFKSYYSATNASGYVTFQYKYQPDGSKQLE